MYVYNCWYAAGWAHDFPAEGLRAQELLDVPLVFYRKADGGLVALEDRCSHRLAPLSAGQIEGDDLRCLYHGLKFDPSGRCVEIPGQPQIPASARVRSYPVVERHSVAWIWMGDAAKADEALIPPFRGVADPAYDMLPGQMEYDAHYMLINDNLLDLSHVAYVHRNSFGSGSDFAEKRPKITRMERGLRVQRWVSQPTPKYIAEKLPQLSHVDTWISYDFLLPGVFLMDAKFFEPGAAERFAHGAPTDEPAHDEFTCQVVTPLSKGRTRYLFAYGPWSRVKGLAEFYRDVSYMAFGEDKVMIEAQQRVIDRSPGVAMQPTSFDAAPSQFRWLVDKLIAAEQQQAAQPATAA